MPFQIIKHHGRPVRATGLDGGEITREDRIFLASHQDWYPTLDYYDHFVYYKKQLGSTLMCTCGSQAGVVGYEAYRKFASYQGPNVIACLYYTEHKSHVDGSH